MMSDISDAMHETNFLENNFKKYLAGNTYNGVQILITAPNWTTAHGNFIPYKTIETSLGSDATFRMFLSIGGTFNPVLAGNVVINISGVVAGLVEPLVAYDSTGSCRIHRCLSASGGGTILLSTYGGDTCGTVYIQGNIVINALPTWSDLII